MFGHNHWTCCNLSFSCLNLSWLRVWSRKTSKALRLEFSSLYALKPSALTPRPLFYGPKRLIWKTCPWKTWITSLLLVSFLSPFIWGIVISESPENMPFKFSLVRTQLQNHVVRWVAKKMKSPQLSLLLLGADHPQDPAPGRVGAIQAGSAERKNRRMAHVEIPRTVWRPISGNLWSWGELKSSCYLLTISPQRLTFCFGKWVSQKGSNGWFKVAKAEGSKTGWKSRAFYFLHILKSLCVCISWNGIFLYNPGWPGSH